MVGNSDLDQMKISANSIAEPNQPPTLTHAADDPGIIDEGSFWNRQKRKLFKKK